MTLTFTPVSDLGFITDLSSGDYLLLWDASAANQAGRITLEALGNYLTIAATQIDWVNILNKPITFPPSGHTHTKDQITDLSLTWGDVTDKPATFPPSGHTHTTADITGLDLSGEQIGAIRCTRQRFSFSGFVTMPSSQSLYFAPAWDSLWTGLLLESFDYQIMANVYPWDASNFQRLNIGGVSLNGSFFNISPQLPLAAIADSVQRKEKLAINIPAYSGNLSNTANRLLSLNFAPVGSINGLLQFTFFYRGILA